MGSVIELYKNFSSIDLTEIVQEIIGADENKYIELQRNQLWDGKGSDDKNLRPSYSEDPYFKKPGAAERYANWKSKITPNPKRDKDTPNLYVVGKFYSEINLQKTNEGYMYKVASFGNKVISKFDKALGLNETTLASEKENTLKETLKIIRDGLRL